MMRNIEEKLYHIINKPWLIPLSIARRGWDKMIPDKLYLKCRYREVFGRWPNFKNPRTFNEKLQWLKLYDRKPIYTTMVDKYAVKEYVARIIGEEHIIPTLGVWEKFDDIDFKQLPNQFVLKCNHDSGGLVICKDKSTFDIENARSIIEKSLATDYSHFGREWPYKNVKRRIIAEKYMEDSETKELRDYKFFCFCGKVKCYKIDFNRTINHHANYYDEDGNLIHAGEVAYPPVFDQGIPQPKELNRMKEMASMLSENIPFLRVDFYDVDGQVYFGELTFYPTAGFGKYDPSEFDIKLGEWLVLPNGGNIS